VAGIGSMSYRKFFLYNILGGAAWVLLFTLAGYFFGNLPFIKEHFSIVIIVIIFLSLAPTGIEYVRAKREVDERGKM
jgi:membrane-associated protein